MDFILIDNDIFNVNLCEEVKNEIIPFFDSSLLDCTFHLTISFNVNLLNDARMDLVDVPLKKWEKNITRKDKIYNILHFQLDKIDKALCDSGLNISRATIQGEELEAINYIKIQLIEQDSRPNTSKNKKNSKPMKVKSVVPSLSFIQDTVSSYAGERLTNIYIDLMKVIRNKKIMSEILEIEATEDDRKLFDAFCNQYQDLWFPTKDEKEFLLNKLREKVESVVKKNTDNNGSNR
ncbi:hypothetical protein [Paenibacillus odorifer]|uniref:hypothetical protein n=1 Tax=Paenibacillus odorifer TaxID=189426 RepID=UPI00096C0DA3|nr:hypothetical protein [Paenibacillus odorifer]OMD09853.1 hypothetical protein BJP50_29410 [Paenibacillus odorifer]